MKQISQNNNQISFYTRQCEKENWNKGRMGQEMGNNEGKISIYFAIFMQCEQ
jgi:hypothetical protein